MKTRALQLCAALVLAGCSASSSPEGASETDDSPPAVVEETVAPVLAAPDDLAQPPADALVSASGLRSKVQRPGKRLRTPAPHDQVALRFTAWSSDGKVVETTQGQDQPLLQPASAGSQGLQEAISLMAPGEQRRVWMPAKLTADGEGALVYDIELVAIEPGVAPLLAPSDLQAPPPDAKRTGSGLVYRVLAAAEHPGARPKPNDQVQLQYTVWTMHGEALDSSEARGEPDTVRVADLMPGFSEGLQRMQEGERTRLWIPSQLATNARRNEAPQPVVVDVELLEVLSPAP